MSHFLLPLLRPIVPGKPFARHFVMATVEGVDPAVLTLTDLRTNTPVTIGISRASGRPRAPTPSLTATLVEPPAPDREQRLLAMAVDALLNRNLASMSHFQLDEGYLRAGAPQGDIHPYQWRFSSRQQPFMADFLDPAGTQEVGRSVVALVNPPWIRDTTDPLFSAIILSHALEQAGIPHRHINFAYQYQHLAAVRDYGFLTHLTYATPAPDLAAEEAAVAACPAEFEAMVAALAAGPEPLVGFSAFRMNLGMALYLARELKRRAPEKQVVLGGVEVNERGASTFAGLPYLDAVVQGDGMGALVTLAKAAREGRDIAGVEAPGVFTRLRPTGLPAYEPPPSVMSYNIARNAIARGNFFNVPLLLSRGCAFNCAFCNSLRREGPLRLAALSNFERQVQVVEDLFVEVTGSAPATQGVSLDLADCSLNSDWPLAEAALTFLASRPHPRPKLTANLSDDGRFTAARARLMAQAGIMTLYLGVESGSPRVRRAMRKNPHLDRTRETVRLCAEAGIKTIVLFFISGWPDESDEDRELTAEFIEDCRPFGVSLLLNSLALHEGTPLEPMGGRGLSRGSGVLWQGDAPLGDPVRRARLFLETLGRFCDRMPVQSSYPLEYFSTLWGVDIPPDLKEKVIV